MEQLDPGYLRHVYDGLVSGQIHPENPSDLPEGLIGLYEEAFDESISVVARQKNLNIFCLWALLKKEVSAAFVAEILDMSEVEINLFISKYSSWFNSPISGKYQLYHERLKVFLLQKNSEKEIQTLHDKLITRIERAIEEKKADEWECYGLEFLAQHLFINSMLSGNGEKLMKIAYDHNFWERQLKISKGFIWTKNGLKATMTWAAKYNNDHVIECGLQMVDLHNKEQSAASQIVALVAEGNFDSAHKRIEQYGGNDKEGIQRKFILYMLCFIELILLDSKDKPYRKEGIENLLKHLDNQLPVDHSVLNWSEFFPNKLMFEVLKGILFHDLTLNIILKRSNFIDLNFLSKSYILSEVEKNLVLGLFLFFEEASIRTITQLSNLSQLLYSNNYIHEATLLNLKAKELTNSINGWGLSEEEKEYLDYSISPSEKDLALYSIIRALNFQNNKNEALDLISEVESEYLKKEIYLHLNEEDELIEEILSKLMLDIESVEGKLNILKKGIEICLLKHILYDDLVSIYIKLLEELDIFEHPEYQVFLVEIYCKLNHIENAIGISKQIALNHYQEIAFQFIALWYFNNYNEELSKDYIKKINSPSIKSRLYSSLVISIVNNNLKTSYTGIFDLLIFELNNIEAYTTDDWGSTEYPRNELIFEIGFKFHSNDLTDLAFKLGSQVIDECNAKRLYYLKIFSDFDFLKDGILSPYFHTYITNNKMEIDTSRRDEYLIQIITEYWGNSDFKKALCVLSFITNILKLEKIISDLVLLCLENLNFSFLPDLLNFMDSDFSKDVCLSEALSQSEIKFELNHLDQILSNFHDAKEKNRCIANFVQKQFDLNRPIFAIQMIDLIEDSFWKCIGLECSVYYFGKVMNVEKGKEQLEEIKHIKRRFKVNIDVNEIEMNFFDSISSEMYFNHYENWIIFNKKSISISKKIIDRRVKKYNEFLFLLRSKKYSDLLSHIELITDDWDRSLFISGIGIELFCVEHLELIDRIISLYPENQKEGNSGYRDFISKYILLCERNNQCKYLVEHYKYFESDWLDSLELAKQLLQINRMKKAEQVLNSIDNCGKAWAFIRFSEFLRINYNEKKSKPFLDKGISISMKKNETTGIKRAIIELINSGNYLLAEKISVEIKNIKDKQDCWSEIGRTLYANKTKVIINSKFKEMEFKKFVNRSWLEEHTIIDSNKQFIINSLPNSIEDLSIIETILQKYFLNKLFINLNFEEPNNQFDTVLKLHWAIEIKNQINYLS